MNKKLLAITLMSLILTGCDKAASVMSTGVKCDSDITKQIVIETFSKNISDISGIRVKELIETENITVDMGKLRSALQKITFNVTNVRTNNSDPNSKKTIVLQILW